MKNLLTTILLFTLLTPIYAEVKSYDAKAKMEKIDFAQNIFRKKLQRKCGFTASYWAQQHTENEWETFQSHGTFKDELATMCPKGITVVKDKWMESLYLFSVEYAKDSGKRPRC